MMKRARSVEKRLLLCGGGSVFSSVFLSSRAHERAFFLSEEGSFSFLALETFYKSFASERDNNNNNNNV